MPTTRFVLVALAVIVLFYGLHRLALWAEHRGWIYYRDKRGTSGSLGNAFLQIQTIIEPSKRYVLEQRLDDHSEQREAGDPPSGPAGGTIVGSSEKDDDDSYLLHAFLGGREPISCLAGHLAGSKVVDLGQGGLYMIPFSKVVHEAAQARPGDQLDVAGGWPFRGIDPDTAHRLAGLAGKGRVGYIEIEGHGDSGVDTGIGWQDGRVCVGPLMSVMWVDSAVDQIAYFLGARGLPTLAPSRFPVLDLSRHTYTEEW